jgi:protein-S-isoprenylcysteine O-methyltransferase Ste14
VFPRLLTGPGPLTLDGMTRSRGLLLAYAGVAYLSFLAVTAWGVGFLAGLSWAPTTVDGPARSPAWSALLGNGALLLAFAVHHSVAARPGVKRRMARVLPAAAERSTYVLVAAALLALVFWQWQPLRGGVWLVEAQPWVAVLGLLYALGWVIAIAATFMIDHWDFVGLRQAAARSYAPPRFTERWLYAWVRHPLMLGLLIAFWATPRMTVSHLVFALAGTGYIAVGLFFEERDLRRTLGADYLEYADRVPAVLPRARPGRAGWLTAGHGPATPAAGEAHAGQGSDQAAGR